jgi:hypothetical protein
VTTVRVASQVGTLARAGVGLSALAKTANAILIAMPFGVGRRWVIKMVLILYESAFAPPRNNDARFAGGYSPNPSVIHPVALVFEKQVANHQTLPAPSIGERLDCEGFSRFPATRVAKVSRQ